MKTEEELKTAKFEFTRPNDTSLYELCFDI